MLLPSSSLFDCLNARFNPFLHCSLNNTPPPLQSSSTQQSFDGASRGNPGRAGCGYVVVDVATHERLFSGCRALPRGTTNNEAEYRGLLAGLEVRRLPRCVCFVSSARLPSLLASPLLHYHTHLLKHTPTPRHDHRPQRAAALRARRVVAKGDSLLVARQVSGLYRCTEPRLKALLEEVTRLGREAFESFEVRHVYR